MSMEKISKLTLEDVLGADLGDFTNGKVLFRKTVQVKDYESETVEVSVDLGSLKEKPAEIRELILAMAEVQLEYTVYSGLVLKQLITEGEYRERKKKNTEYIQGMMAKAVSLGMSVEDIYKYIGKGE